MGTVKGIKTKADTHELFANQTQEIGLPDAGFRVAIDTDNVYVVENYNRYPIKLIYDGEKIHINFVYEDGELLKKQVYKTFNEKYTRPFSKVVHLFSKIPFVVFGEFVPEKNEIAVFDMYINQNWISFSHFREIMDKVGFSIPRILYRGLYDEDVIRKVMNSVDSEVWVDRKIEYTFIKPDMEVDYTDGGRNYRLGAVMTAWKQKTEEEKKSETEEKKKATEKAQSVIREYLKSVVDGTIVEAWRMLLKEKNVAITSKNKGIILPEVVKEMLFFLEVEIEELSQKHNIETEILKEAIKSILPKIVMKYLNI